MELLVIYVCDDFILPPRTVSARNAIAKKPINGVRLSKSLFILRCDGYNCECVGGSRNTPSRAPFGEEVRHVHCSCGVADLDDSFPSFLGTSTITATINNR
jgi:hypothetical protein